MNVDVASFQRRYNNEIQLCNNLLQIIKWTKDQAASSGCTAQDLRNVAMAKNACSPTELIAAQVYLESMEDKLKNACYNIEALSEDYDELREHEAVLKTSSTVLSQAGVPTTPGSTIIDMEMRNTSEGSLLQVHFLCGTVPIQKVAAFELVLWRACRGNVYFSHAEISEELPDPVTGRVVKKMAFALLVQGEKLRSKVKRICDGFRAKLYTSPITERERELLISDIAIRMIDLKRVLDTTVEQKQKLLCEILPCLPAMTVQLRKCRGVYYTLNMFRQDQHQKSLICDAWYPLVAAGDIHNAIASATEKVGHEEVPCLVSHHPLSSCQEAPTFNRVNEFTKSFQGLIDAYGMNTYGEINPGLFSIITFPFLFAVMFGDFGHGLLITTFALTMILNEKRIGRTRGINEIFKTLYSGRYLILLMGAFSTYTGLIYNEALSKPVTTFRSQWKISNASRDVLGLGADSTIQLNPQFDYTGFTYPFGQDPTWSIASNKITFNNSYKMKLSVILGVIQMMFGIVLNVLNFVHYEEYFELIAEFVPEIIFISCLFGYLVVLTVAKWTWHFENTSCAPSLLIGFISMFLMEDPAQSETATRGCEPLLYASYHQQRYVEEGLLFAALICVPWLLLAKPVFACIIWKHRSLSAATESTHGGSVGLLPSSYALHREETEGIGDMFIRQAIHTIEYCLGCVSHTASYLRLWALSLAHVELSEVLWDMVLRNGIKVPGYYGSIGIFAVFPFFAVLTVAILLVMEGLSAFLHTLRLHWVEFQSKFYKGEGVKFVPFDLKVAAKMED